MEYCQITRCQGFEASEAMIIVSSEIGLNLVSVKSGIGVLSGTVFSGFSGQKSDY